MKYLITLLLTITCLDSQAYSIAAGTYVPYFNKIQTNVEGDTKKFELNPYVGIAGHFQMSSQQYFIPEFGYAYYLDSSKNVKRDTFFLHYNFGYVLSERLLLRYGLTTHWYRIMGSGGTQSLSNGNGKTEFPLPNETVITYFSTLDIGVDYFINNKNNSIRFDLNTMSFSELDNRAYNYILTFSWYR